MAIIAASAGAVAVAGFVGFKVYQAKQLKNAKLNAEYSNHLQEKLEA